jgi:hypothetical protein
MKSSFNFNKLALAAAVMTVVGAQQASAILTWDLRAVSVTGPGSVTNTKSVLGDVGTVVTLDLWAVVTGTGAVDETLLSGIGMLMANAAAAPTPVGLDAAVAGNNAILGTPFTLKGNFATIEAPAKGNLVAPWSTAAVSTNGIARDLNGDGFLDIGGSSSTSTAGGMFAINAGASQSTGGVGDFNTLANGREWRVAQFKFTIASAAPASAAGVNFVVPLFGSSLNNNARASFNQDVGAAENGAAANLAVAAPVIITAVPEPSSFAMVLMGALGLVGFRRLGLRRSA